MTENQRLVSEIVESLIVNTNLRASLEHTQHDSFSVLITTDKFLFRFHTHNANWRGMVYILRPFALRETIETECPTTMTEPYTVAHALLRAVIGYCSTCTTPRLTP